MYRYTEAICNKTFTTAAELAPVWHGYRTALYPHLVEEENIMIPLMRAYFTPAEVMEKTTVGPLVQLLNAVS